MVNNYGQYSIQELRCLIARHSDEKKENEVQHKILSDNLYELHQELWSKLRGLGGVIGE
jgi:hypothetical protein